MTHEDEIKSQLYTGHELLIQQGQKQNEKAVYSLDICAFLINSVLSFLIYTDLVIKEWFKILNACSKAFIFMCVWTHNILFLIFMWQSWSVLVLFMVKHAFLEWQEKPRWKKIVTDVVIFIPKCTCWSSCNCRNGLQSSRGRKGHQALTVHACGVCFHTAGCPVVGEDIKAYGNDKYIPNVRSIGVDGSARLQWTVPVDNWVVMGACTDFVIPPGRWNNIHKKIPTL